MWPFVTVALFPPKAQLVRDATVLLVHSNMRVVLLVAAKQVLLQSFLFPLCLTKDPDFTPLTIFERFLNTRT